MSRHAIVRAAAAGIVLVPLLSLAQGAADGSAGSSGSAQSGTGSAPAGSAVQATSAPAQNQQPVLSPQPTPSSTPSTTTAQQNAVPAVQPAPVSATPAATTTQSAPAEPSETDPMLKLSKALQYVAYGLGALLLLIPFGWAVSYFWKRRPMKVEKDDPINRCIDIKQMLDQKIRELTDLKAMAQDKTIDMGKELMKDLVTGTKTGDVLLKIQQVEEQVNKLKKMYEECQVDIDRYRYKGVLVENSLADKSMLEHIRIVKTHTLGTWTIHDIRLSKTQIEQIQQNMVDRTWYFHLWEPGKDDVTVVFKDAIFQIKHSDKRTWRKAIEHGLLCGVPESQLDFPIL